MSRPIVDAHSHIGRTVTNGVGQGVEDWLSAMDKRRYSTGYYLGRCGRHPGGGAGRHPASKRCHSSSRA